MVNDVWSEWWRGDWELVLLDDGHAGGVLMLVLPMVLVLVLLAMLVLLMVLVLVLLAMLVLPMVLVLVLLAYR